MVVDCKGIAPERIRDPVAVAVHRQDGGGAPTPWFGGLATCLGIPTVAIGAPYARGFADEPVSIVALLGMILLMRIIIRKATVLLNRIEPISKTMDVENSKVPESGRWAVQITLMSAAAVFGPALMVTSDDTRFGAMVTTGIGGLIVASLLRLIIASRACDLLLKPRKMTSALDTDLALGEPA
ncbi:MAG: hypothetical protein AAGA19_17420 [Pseudomonadota bacterium]